MSIGLAFYILMFLWLFGAMWTRWPLGPQVYGLDLLLFVLFLLLGWHAFGAPIHG